MCFIGLGFQDLLKANGCKYSLKPEKNLDTMKEADRLWPTRGKRQDNWVKNQANKQKCKLLGI